MLLTAVVRDISERKRLESKQIVLLDQLRALNDRFELALENMTHGLAFYDADHRLLVWNRRLEEMFRLPPGVFREGMAWREVLQIVADINFPPEHRIRMIEERLKIARWDGDQTLRLRLIDERVIDVCQRPTPDGGRVQVLIDVTESERYEQELLAAREIAELANRSKSEFLADAAQCDPWVRPANRG